MITYKTRLYKKSACMTKKKAKVSAKIIQNHINGLILIALGASTLFFPMDNGESDSTAFIMLAFIGLAALFSKE